MEMSTLCLLVYLFSPNETMSKYAIYLGLVASIVSFALLC